jgi:hypothetical protein
MASYAAAYSRGERPERGLGDFMGGSPDPDFRDFIGSNAERKRLWDGVEDHYEVLESMMGLAYQALGELAELDPEHRDPIEWLRTVALENAQDDEELRKLLGDDYDY